MFGFSLSSSGFMWCAIIPLGNKKSGSYTPENYHVKIPNWKGTSSSKPPFWNSMLIFQVWFHFEMFLSMIHFLNPEVGGGFKTAFGKDGGSRNSRNLSVEVVLWGPKSIATGAVKFSWKTGTQVRNPQLQNQWRGTWNFTHSRKLPDVPLKRDHFII